MKRKIYLQKKAGSLKNLILKEDILTENRENEVTVEVKSIGLNFADIFAIKGLYSATPKGEFIPGLEYSGVVIRKEKKVNGIEIGDRVMGASKFGSYASHLNIDYRYTRKLKDSWTFEDGASFLVQALTAFYALVILGSIKENRVVLIHSAAGGVGIWANRIAQKFNAFTVGTLGNISKANIIKDENYGALFERNKNFKIEIDKILNGKKPDIILDPVGGRYFKEGYEILNQGGRLITYGSANFNVGRNRPDYLKVLLKYLTRPKIDPMQMINRNKSVMGFNLIYLWDRIEEMGRYTDELIAMDLGKPKIDSVHRFENLKDALYYFQEGRSTGKIVVSI